jgi:hypothetical protein
VHTLQEMVLHFIFEAAVQKSESFLTKYFRPQVLQ